MDLDRNPAVVAHGDGGFDLSYARTWFRDGLLQTHELIAEHHGWDIPDWASILGIDSPLLELATAISDHRDSGGLDALFATLGIEVTSEAWGGEMPGHGGHYMIAWADGKTRQRLRTGFRRLHKALAKWNEKQDRESQAREKNAARLEVLRQKLERLESREALLARKKAALVREIKDATQFESRFQVHDALAELDEEGRRLCRIARRRDGRFHQEGMLLIDPAGRIWRIYGDAHPNHAASVSDDIVAAIKRRRRRVIDVQEYFERGQEPPRGQARAHFTWEGWTQKRSRLRFAEKQAPSIPDPESIRQAFLDWCDAEEITLPPTRDNNSPPSK